MISRYLIWSKTLMELIFNLLVNFGVVRWAQLATSPLLNSTLVLPGIFSDLLGSVQMLKREREWDAESNGKLAPLLNSVRYF